MHYAKYVTTNFLFYEVKNPALHGRDENLFNLLRF